MPRSTRSRGALAALALLVVLAGALLLRPAARAHEGEDHGDGAAATPAASTDGTITVPQDAQFALGIRTEIADTQAVAESMRLQGELVPGPGAEAVVSSPQAGRLVSGRLPGVGQAVRAGQVIGTVEGALAAPDVAGLRADRADAEAGVAQARADVVRLRAIARVVARKEVEAAEIRLRGAEARLAALSGALGAGNRYAITVPISGVVSEVTAAPGAFVEAGAPILRVVSLTRLQVRARVAEADLGRVRGAAPAATVTADGYPDASFRARLTAFGAVIDPTSRTLDAVFSVENPNGLLKSGQTVNVDVALGAAAFAVTVPEAAIVRDEAGAPTVFVHPTAEGFAVRRVTLGPVVGARVAITAGLRAGERVVVAGAYSLRGQ